LIDVHRLAVLREVARAGSFAGAAVALHHTPSAVSQQIAALERGTGIVLVERSTRGVILTDAGRTLLATADAIHAELQLAAQRLRALAADGPQALTVVTFPSAGEPLLAPSLTAMTAAAGDPVEITVIEAEPDEALGAVRDGRADLALVYHFHTAAPPRGWPAIAGTGTYVPLAADPLRLLVPAGHPLAGHSSASLAEVADERWIQGWGDVGDVTDMLAALSGFRLQVACRSSDYRFMSALVGAGVGVALVPSLALTGSLEVRALQITPQLTRYIGAWLPRRHQPNPAAGQLLAALRANKWPDYTAMFVANVGFAVPSFLIATLLIYFFAVRWGDIFDIPTSGWTTWQSKILPTIALGLGPMAYFARLTRGSVLETLQQDYIRTARAKGLRRRRVVVVHTLRNSLIPVVTAAGPILGFLITGSFVIEQIFAIPGIGRYYVTAVTGRDYSVVMGLTVLLAMIVIVANMVVDILYGILDPRTREAR